VSEVLDRLGEGAVLGLCARAHDLRIVPPPTTENQFANRTSRAGRSAGPCGDTTHAGAESWTEPTRPSSSAADNPAWRPAITWLGEASTSSCSRPATGSATSGA